MATPLPEPLVFPICRYVGEQYDLEADTSSYRLRGGWQIVELTQQERDIWALAHGLNNRIKQGVRWTRDALLDSAGPSRAQVDPVVRALLDKQVLAEVLPGTDAAVEFAQRVRLLPMQLGVGNSKQQSWVWRIGSPAGGIEVSEVVYQIWEWGYLHRNLWEACQALAKLNAQDYDSPEEVPECDPTGVLTEVLTSAHELLSSTCAFFDRTLDWEAPGCPVVRHG